MPLPNAPVAGSIVIKPDVALPILTEPSVPEAPSVSAPLVSPVDVSVVQPPEPLAVSRLPEEPPVEQPEPPEAAAHVGFADEPCV